MFRFVHTFALIIAIASAQGDRPVTPEGLVHADHQQIVYRGPGWGLRAEAGRGWVSLRLGEAEFLASSDAHGGILYRRGDQWITSYPALSNLSHDRTVGRQGSVADGIFLLKMTPDSYQPGAELYAGFNDDRDHDLVLLLSDDVVAVRLGSAERERGWQRSTVSRQPQSGKLTPAREAMVVHRDGYALIVRSEFSRGNDDKGKPLPPTAFQVGTIADPAGQPRLAIVLPCKGMAQNSLRLIPETVPRGENLVVTPQFDVISSDDAANTGLKPVNGVGNPLYTPETKLDFGIGFGWLGDRPFTGYAEVEVIHATRGRHFYQKVELNGVSPDEQGRIRVAFQPRFTMPGTSEVWGRLVDRHGRLIWTERYRMGYDLEHFVPDIFVQPDHKQFWDDALAKLAEIPLAAETRRVHDDHPDWEMYEVTFATWGGQRIVALMWVNKEAKARAPLPAIVSAHPNVQGWGLKKNAQGLYGSDIGKDPRFVTIIPLIRGHQPDAPDIPFNLPWWGDLTSRETHAALSWFCTMKRTVDYLATRPDLVDMKRVVATGGSQGGCLALITAALDQRVAYCISDCPANAQLHELVDGKYPSFGPGPGQVPEGQTADDLKRTLSYFDPVNFAPWITCPTYVGSNIGDLTVHSMGPLACYHNLTALPADRKAFYPGFTHFHGSGPGLGQKREEIYRQLGGEK